MLIFLLFHFWWIIFCYCVLYLGPWNIYQLCNINPKKSNLMNHNFIFFTGYKKGLFILAYFSCVIAFESSNPIPNSSPGEANLQIFYDVASYSCPSIFFPALCSLTIVTIIKTLAFCSIWCRRLGLVNIIFSPSKCIGNVTISGLIVCVHLEARLHS